MPIKDNLTIHKLSFEIQLDSEDDFKEYADRISRLTKVILPNRLEFILDKFDLPEGNLVINKLELDLGNIPNKRLEKTIVNAIASEIESFLSKNIRKIKQEIAQAHFKASVGGKYEVRQSDFQFKSEITFEKSTILQEEIKKTSKEIIDLNEYIITEDRRIVRKTSKIEKGKHKTEVRSQIQPSEETSPKKTEEEQKTVEPVVDIELPTGLEKEPEVVDNVKKTSKKEVEVRDKTPETDKDRTEIIIQRIQEKVQEHKAFVQEDIVSKKIQPKKSKLLTPLDKAFIYYLKYGRLPSNVKYELGTSMLDVFNINQREDGFLDELSKQIESDDQAKERLSRLLDQTKKESEFDPRIPKSFEDYFTALVHGLSTEFFSAGIRRYNLNDMIRFIYADNPNKLKQLILYLIKDYDSQSNWSSLVDDLFKRISKPSIVKLISSFVRKGAYINKNLNELNRAKGRNLKSSHKELFKLLVSGGDTSIFAFEIKPRVFLSEGPKYQNQFLDNSQLVEYFFDNNSIPYIAGNNIKGDRLNSAVLSLTPGQISRLSIFRNKQIINYESVGNLSERAIMHLVKSLNPNLESDISSNYRFFKYNIESGIPEGFQKAFMLYYAVKDHRKSYLEEMISYWKEQFGDADSVIKQRWKVKDEIGKQLNMLLALTSKKIKEELKVDFTYDSYAKDISVKNAGLVILWPFLKVYFNMLDLLNPEGNFRSLKERGRACHLLQYLAIERSYGDEFYYPLNKILTGYPLDEPLPYEITMTKKEIDVSNALLKNVIKQWNALKGGSVDGLRGSFLIRDGILVTSPNGWLLTVENKAYDILMDKLPWGIGMIKLSWAPYVLNVEWERKIM